MSFRPFVSLKITALYVALAVIVSVSVTAVGGYEPFPGSVSAVVTQVTDGDTVKVKAYIWLGQHLEINVRLDGVDTPEIKGKCREERQLARKAKNFVISKIKDRTVFLKAIKYGKYAGRVVARIETPEGEDLGAALIRAGLGRVYKGGKRQPWCYPGQP